jgi:hypothetical protein
MKGRKYHLGLVLLGAVAFTSVLILTLESPGWTAPSQSWQRQTVPTPTLVPQGYLPLVLRNFAQGASPEFSQTALCRFGFGSASRPINAYDPTLLAQLRAGLYMDWNASAAPSQPNGIEYVQTVRVKQWKWKDGQRVYADYQASYEIPYTYTISPRGSTLQAIAWARPTSLWLIGNETERRDWKMSNGETACQDEILPEVYAQAYYEAYTTIKAADPTARIAIGGVIQATPLRLEYLNRVWNEYYRLYGHTMPVDWWNVHAFVLQEKRNDWGADIPAGITVTEGMLYTVEDNKDWNKATELIRAFRQWMKEHGQQDKPLIVSEYGVNIPWFPAEQVRDEFMYPSFDFFLNEKDPALGYPADEYRLVQRWIWYSLDDDSGVYNGFLLHSGKFESPMGLAPLGEYWKVYVNNPINVPAYVNLVTARVGYTPPSLFSSGETVTATVHAEVSNSGNIPVNTPFTIEVWDEDHHQILGSEVISDLTGCGETRGISITWANLSTGAHHVSVRVDTGDTITESNEADNQIVGIVLVATERVFLPVVIKESP